VERAGAPVVVHAAATNATARIVVKRSLRMSHLIQLHYEGAGHAKQASCVAFVRWPKSFDTEFTESTEDTEKDAIPRKKFRSFADVRDSPACHAGAIGPV
jgi:hypothetical protein